MTIGKVVKKSVDINMSSPFRDSINFDHVGRPTSTNVKQQHSGTSTCGHLPKADTWLCELCLLSRGSTVWCSKKIKQKKGPSGRRVECSHGWERKDHYRNELLHDGIGGGGGLHTCGVQPIPLEWKNSRIFAMFNVFRVVNEGNALLTSSNMAAIT